mmetsp:Transcript_116443/g.276758  ORF Transcript_116443/g.276758 Transcript_116443/m.276758 type:complete len:273 (-) Transcript_116443:687-1505(-)
MTPTSSPTGAGTLAQEGEASLRRRRSAAGSPQRLPQLATAPAELLAERSLHCRGELASGCGQKIRKAQARLLPLDGLPVGRLIHAEGHHYHGHGQKNALLNAVEAPVRDEDVGVAQRGHLVQISPGHHVGRELSEHFHGLLLGPHRKDDPNVGAVAEELDQLAPEPLAELPPGDEARGGHVLRGLPAAVHRHAAQGHDDHLDACRHQPGLVPRLRICCHARFTPAELRIRRPHPAKGRADQALLLVLFDDALQLRDREHEVPVWAEEPAKQL